MGNAFAQNDVMTLLIGKDIGAVSHTTSAGSPILAATDTYILDGEITVVNGHNIVLDAGTVLTNALAVRQGIRVVQRSGTKLVYSDFIKKGQVQSYVGTADSAAAEQVSYVGYNGVGASTAIDTLNSNSYQLKIPMTEGDDTGFGTRPSVDAVYKSDTNATQAEIAVGLHIGLAGSLLRNPEAPMRAERVVKAASITDSENIFTVLNGSKYVTVTTQAEWTGNIAMAAADVIRIGTSGSGAAATDPAYVITSVSGLVLTLDVPFQGVSGAIPATDCALVNTPTNWGIKLTGLARTFSLGKQGSINNIVRFLLGITNFGTTDTTYTTTASEGTGTYKQIAELEWFLQGNEGNTDRMDFMYSTARADATSGKTYDTLSIGYVDDAEAGLGGIQRSPKQLLVALEQGYAGGEGPDLLIDTLDSFCAASSGIGI